MFGFAEGCSDFGKTGLKESASAAKPAKIAKNATKRFGGRMTFISLGEQWLGNWMAENAFVCGTENNDPWLLEDQLPQNYSPSLHIQDGRHHPFCSSLFANRSDAKRLVKEMPAAQEGYQRRQMKLVEV